MKITDIKVYPSRNPQSRSFWGWVNVTLDGSMTIREIAIMQGKNGLWVRWPGTTRTMPDGSKKRFNIIWLEDDLRNYLNGQILQAVERQSNFNQSSQYSGRYNKKSYGNKYKSNKYSSNKRSNSDNELDNLDDLDDSLPF